MIGKRASVGYEDGTLKLWDLRQGMHTFHLSGKNPRYLFQGHFSLMHKLIEKVLA